MDIIKELDKKQSALAIFLDTENPGFHLILFDLKYPWD